MRGCLRVSELRRAVNLQSACGETCVHLCRARVYVRRREFARVSCRGRVYQRQQALWRIYLSIIIAAILRTDINCWVVYQLFVRDGVEFCFVSVREENIMAYQWKATRSAGQCPGYC